MCSIMAALSVLNFTALSNLSDLKKPPCNGYGRPHCMMFSNVSDVVVSQLHITNSPGATERLACLPAWFASLADQFSEDPGSAKNKGELDWLGKGVLAPEFEKTMIEIEPGKVSEIFQTEFGFHFLEVLDKRNYDMTRDLIKDEAYAILYERKYDEELENTLRSIRAEAFVEFKDLD